MIPHNCTFITKMFLTKISLTFIFKTARALDKRKLGKKHANFLEVDPMAHKLISLSEFSGSQTLSDFITGPSTATLLNRHLVYAVYETARHYLVFPKFLTNIWRQMDD